MLPKRGQGPYENAEQISMASYASETENSKSRRPYEREQSDFSYASIQGSGVAHDNTDGSNLIEDRDIHHHAPPRRFVRHRILTNWWRETVAVCLLVGFAIAIFTTLYPYQGRPIPEWPLSITINALLSVYILIIRGSAGYLLAEGLAHQKWRWFDEKARPLYDLSLHDEASRGPYGAVKLLFRVSPRHIWHWLGCLLIIVAVIIGPISQQVVQYVDCTVPADIEAGRASIPRSNIFIGAGRHSGAGLITITQPEQAAINAGVFAPGGHVPFNCPSGNCTIPDYTTIGYCSACVDVSSEMQISNGNFSFDEGGETSWSSGTLSTLPSGTSMLWLNYTNLPNLSTVTGPNTDNNFQFMVGLPGAPYDAETGLAPTGCDGQAAQDTWRCKGYGAANCTFFPCIRTYRANITNGELDETLISETANPGPFTSFGTLADGRDVTAALDADCLQPDETDLLRRAGYIFNSTTQYIPYNMTGSNESFVALPKDISLGDILAFENATQARGCLYAQDIFFDQSLDQIFYTTFPGNLSGAKNNDGNEIQFFYGSQFLQTFYNFGDFSFERTDSLIGNVSESLTNHMRTTPGTNITSLFEPAYGQQSEDKTCVHVVWRWLVLPAALVVLTLIYVVGALLSLGGISHGMRTWRSSPLPLIYHGPDIRAVRGQVGGGLQDIRDMVYAAKQVCVRLVPDVDGSTYMQVQQSAAGS